MLVFHRSCNNHFSLEDNSENAIKSGIMVGRLPVIRRFSMSSPSKSYSQWSNTACLVAEEFDPDFYDWNQRLGLFW